MTWTWNDDDPATSASAENFNTHIELRLRALEVAGGGGGGSDVTAAVQRNLVPDSDDYVTPIDNTKATIVTAGFHNTGGAASEVAIYTETGTFFVQRTIQAGAYDHLTAHIPSGTRYAIEYGTDIDPGAPYEQSPA